RALCEHRFECAPPEFRSGEQRADDDRDRGTDGEGRAHHEVDELVGVEGQDVGRAIARLRGVQREVPAEEVDEDGDPRDDARGHEKRGPKSTLTPFRLDGCDHDPCFSPVSWKKTSSSDLSNGRSSLTPMPAATSWRLMSTLLLGLVLRWSAPSWRLITSAPNILVRTSCAAPLGSARPSTPS